MTTFHTLIQHAKIIDGSGNPWFYGDVALQDDCIAAIAAPNQIAADQAAEVVDATGMVVCPGFIDILSHSILPLMVDGRCLSKITQGVTTEIMGEGWTPGPINEKIDTRSMRNNPFAKLAPEWVERMGEWHHFRDWLEALADRGVSPNIGSFLGGGTLRQMAMGMEMGEPSAEELAVMRKTMAAAMEGGAMGVSCALIYPPSAYSSTAELVEVCKVVSEYNGLYITHIRSEADGLLEGIEEALTIGQRANVPVQIYHLKAAGKRNWPKMAQVIERITDARAGGQDITADMYTYPAAGTGLTSVLPPWAAAGGKLYDNLRDPAMRAKIKAEALQPSGGWEAMADLCGPEGVMPIGFTKPEHQPYVAKRLSEIAEMRGQDWVDATFDLLVAEDQRIGTIYFMMTDDNLRLQLQQPWIMIGTDAGGLDPAWAAPTGPYHPRAYGTYTRVLGRFVREEGVLPLEDAIRKMSSAVAQRLGIRDRGLLREGLQADVVIFDPATVADRATFAEPHQLSVGVRDVWVNGGRVLRDGHHTGNLPGRIVDGPGRR
ncbi:MAG TPA: D-aminoacylase [Caldilineaceae bacterium]|nr:D-aminoacylase [Caldilineaceae bacterium]